jgi:hypothetical protein
MHFKAYFEIPVLVTQTHCSPLGEGFIVTQVVKTFTAFKEL